MKIPSKSPITEMRKTWHVYINKLLADHCLWSNIYLPKQVSPSNSSIFLTHLSLQLFFLLLCAFHKRKIFNREICCSWPFEWEKFPLPQSPSFNDVFSFHYLAKTIFICFFLSFTIYISCIIENVLIV